MLRTAACFIVLVSIVLAPICARAADAMGPGVMTCAEFAKLYQKSSDGAETWFFTWGQGYMTATNQMFLHMGKTPIDFSAAPLPDQMTFVRDYCADHPLDQYVTAIIVLLERFQASQKPR